MAIAKLSEVIKIQQCIKNENEGQRHKRLEDIRHQTSEGVKNESEEQRVNENQPGQRESKRIKIENNSNDDWVRDFDMDKVINAYHIFLKKNKGSAICIS
jgi:hypothetical protein